MVYLDDETLSLLEEDDDDEALYEENDDYEALYEEDDDDEGVFYDDDEGLAEDDAERRYFRRGRRRRTYSRPRLRRTRVAQGRSLGRGIRGLRQATLQTPRGSATIRLPMSVVTKTELKRKLDEIGKLISQNGKAIKEQEKSIRKVDKFHRSRVTGLESRLSKFEKSVDKKISAAQQQALLPLLLQSPPELKTLTVDAGTPVGGNTQYTVTNAEFTEEDNMILLLALAGSGGGGLFGGGSSNQLVTTLLLAQAIK